MKNNYVSVIGSLNYDFFLRVSKEPENGETLNADKVEFSCGGKGANQAYQIGKLGIETYMFGCVGNDSYGEKSIDSLRKANINVNHIEIKDNNTGLGFVTVQSNGDVKAIIDSGANKYVGIEYVKSRYEVIFNSKIIVLQMEIPIEIVEYIIKEASKNNNIIILNAAPAYKIQRSVLKLVDYLVVNEVEASFYINEFLGKKTNDLLSDTKQLNDIVKKGIVLTLGAKGSYYISSNNLTHINAVKTKVIDTTGAGDSYIGAFVVGLFNGLDPIKACNLGAKASSITITNFGRESMPSKLE